MRVNVNLATQPYQDARKFYTTWALLLLAVTVVSGGLIFLAVRGWQSSHSVSHLVSLEKEKLAKLEDQERQDEAILNRAENRDVREQGQFINELIRRKAVSWTKIFADLEKMMPPRLHVVSISPQINDEGQIGIHMQVAGDSRERAFELVRRMEESKKFRYPQVVSETARAPNESGGDPMAFDISAQYVPDASRSAP